jgi:hypothetical protein
VFDQLGLCVEVCERLGSRLDDGFGSDHIEFKLAVKQLSSKYLFDISLDGSLSNMLLLRGMSLVLFLSSMT